MVFCQNPQQSLFLLPRSGDDDNAHILNVLKKNHKLFIHVMLLDIKYDKQDQQEKAAFNERSPHPTQQQEPVAEEPRRTLNKNRTRHKTEHGHVNH
jgi:hypothetical protein